MAFRLDQQTPGPRNPCVGPTGDNHCTAQLAVGAGADVPAPRALGTLQKSALFGDNGHGAVISDDLRQRDRLSPALAGFLPRPQESRRAEPMSCALKTCP